MKYLKYLVLMLLMLSMGAMAQTVSELHYTGSTFSRYYQSDSAVFGMRSDDDQLQGLLASEDVDRGMGLSQQTLLIKASKLGNVMAVRHVIKRDADINLPDAYGMTPLMHAALAGHKNIVALLVKSGADVHAKDNFGNTALSWAVIGKAPDVVRFLAEQQGAEYDAHTSNNFGLTPADYADAMPGQVLAELA